MISKIAEVEVLSLTYFSIDDRRNQTMQKIALKVASFIFLLVALLHFARAFWSVAISVGQILIPVYASWIGGGICILLSLWMFAASKK